MTAKRMINGTMNQLEKSENPTAAKAIRVRKIISEKVMTWYLISSEFFLRLYSRSTFGLPEVGC
jgi:hypothetical protein